MKILHIIQNLKKGGAERITLDICESFQKKKLDLALIYLENINDYHFLSVKLDKHLITTSINLSVIKKNQIKVDELQKFIFRFQPDIIHTHLFEAELVSRFCNYPKAKWFSHVHDNMVQLNNLSFKSLSNKQTLTNYYEKILLFKNYHKNGGTHFIAISSHTEAYIKSVQSKYPVTLLHNAINVKRFQRRLSETEGYTAQNSIQNARLSSVEGNHSQRSSSSVENQPSDPIAIGTPLTTNYSPLTIINIGSFVQKKNQTFILDIIVELNKLNQKVNCFFLGGGPLKAEVEKRAKELNIYNQCQFLGNVENVEEYLWRSNVYIHTATYEPLGLVLLEAMAASLPVVSLDGGGNRDLIENGKNGFILTEQNPKHFAEKIIEVKDNEEMKRYNMQYAQQFDIDNYTNKLLELYQSALNEKTLSAAVDNH
jgi:glycosyltransferase involved in cell wall biosynthesis